MLLVEIDRKVRFMIYCSGSGFVNLSIIRTMSTYVTAWSYAQHGYMHTALEEHKLHANKK
jgi:hypothetical protein